MAFKHDDDRRIEMAENGYVVRVIVVSKETHKITSVWYTLAPIEADEFLSRTKKASGANR